MKYLKRFNESVQDLSIQTVKDILLDIYEEEFDSSKFRFIEFNTSSEHKPMMSIDYIDSYPEKEIIYLNILKDNESGSIKISALISKYTVIPDALAGKSDLLSAWNSEKLDELESTMSYYGYNFSRPPKAPPTNSSLRIGCVNSFGVAYPIVDERDRTRTRLSYDTMRESRYIVTAE